MEIGHSLTPPAVLMKGIVKRFPNVSANDGIDFHLETGQIHSLLGENGAGKTTLMRILSGFHRPDEGEILLSGKPVVFNSPRDALDHGIGMIHQHFQLVQNLSVAENISLGMTPGFRLYRDALEIEVMKLSEQYGIDIDGRASIRDLSLGEQQRVEILRMLFRRCKILIMDEPTSVLAPQEIGRLFSIMRRIREDAGSVVFITHKLEEVLEISDAVTVLRRGKVMSVIGVDHLAKVDPGVKTELARMMVGREVIFEIGKKPARTDRVLLEVKDLKVRGDRGTIAVDRLSFTVRRGEVFSVLGVAGNGQRELAEALAGIRSIENGSILLDGKPIACLSRRIAYVPEDRTGTGSATEMSVLENLILTDPDPFLKGPLLRWKKARAHARRLIESYHVAAPDLTMKAGRLSGGNLQKLILAREFARKPILLIAEQPTRGLDIGATEEIWQALLCQRGEGAVLLVSGDIREVLSLSDTILVLFRGQAMDIFSSGDEQRLERIGPMMAGVREKN